MAAGIGNSPLRTAMSSARVVHRVPDALSPVARRLRSGPREVPAPPCPIRWHISSLYPPHQPGLPGLVPRRCPEEGPFQQVFPCHAIQPALAGQEEAAPCHSRAHRPFGAPSGGWGVRQQHRSTICPGLLNRENSGIRPSSASASIGDGNAGCRRCIPRRVAGMSCLSGGACCF